ncbi:LVIVD repeat-containing protein [Litorilituus lipolyticus]|nr:REJ domain-containing protein [Litorilituus lipolyticus]
MKNFQKTFCLIVLLLLNTACGGSTNSKENTPPVVSIGEDLLVNEKQQVNLTANVSDSDGNIATILWQQISGPTVNLESVSTLNSHFIAPTVLASQGIQTVSLSLTVTDNDGGTHSDTVNIEVQAVDEAPVAHAGEDISSLVNEKVIVDCSNSYEPDGEELSYHWQKSASTPDDVVIDNPNSCSAEVFLTNEIRSFDLTLTVSDGKQSASDEVTIFAREYTGAKVNWTDQLNPSQPAGAIQQLMSTDIIDIVIKDNIAYVLDEYSLQILDVSSPQAPVFIRKVTGPDEELLGELPGDLQSLIIDGNKAYISAFHRVMGGGSIEVIVVDITIPTELKALGSLPYTFGIRNPKMTVIDEILYVHTIAYGYSPEFSYLTLFDVSNPNQPQKLSSFKPEGRFTSFSVKGNLVFMLDSLKGFVVVDVSDKSKPALYSEFTFPDMQSIITQNDMAYIGTSQGLAIFDIADPASPVLKSELTTTSGSKELVLDENKLYLATQDGIEVINVNDVTSPEVIGAYQVGHDIKVFSVENDFIYVGTDSGLFLNNKEDLTVLYEPPSLSIKSVLSIEAAKKLQVSNNKAYVIYDNGLNIIDTSNELEPTQLSNLEFGRQSADIKLHNNTALIANNYGVNFIDVTDSAMPILTNTLYVGLNKTLSIATSNNYAYVGGDSDKDHLKIIELSDVAAPSLLKSFDLGLGDNRVTSLVIEKNNLFAVSKNKVSIVDISSPELPRLLNSINISNAVTLAIENEIAFVTDYKDYLTSIDFSDPVNPIILGEIDIGKFYVQNGDDITISDNIAYVANGDNGVTLFDISNPRDMALVGEFFTTHASSITHDDNFVYVAAGTWDQPNSKRSGYVSLNRNLLIDIEQNYNKVPAASIIQYEIIGKNMLPLQYTCMVTVGDCTINKVDDKMVISWETPNVAGDHEIAIFAGNSSLYSAYKDKITIH